MALVTGCGGSPRTEDFALQPELSPIDENTATWPSGTADESFPETFALKSGENDEFGWAHLRGYVHAPLLDVWLAMQNLDIVTDRREVDKWELRKECPEEGFDRCFVIYNFVNNIIDVEFEITWRHKVREGTVDAPENVVIRYQRTWSSTDYIDIIRGSYELVAVGDDRTSFSGISHLKAFGAKNQKQVESSLRDVFKSVVESVHNRPLPKY